MYQTIYSHVQNLVSQLYLDKHFVYMTYMYLEKIETTNIGQWE
jgi:hypothetical protein